MENKTKAILKDLQSHPVTAYINSLTSPNSRRTMLSSLRSVIACALEVETITIDPMQVFTFEWGLITPDKLKALRAALLNRYSDSSASKHFAAVRGVLGSCFDQQLIDSDQWMRIQRVKSISVHRNNKIGRRLSDGEIRALAKVCAADETPAGARDDAILGLGITQGPRIAEVSKIQLSDYDQTSGDLIIRSSKNGKTRTIRASNATKDSLDEWLELRGDSPGALFCRVLKGGDIAIEKISTTSLNRMLKKRASQAGVEAFSMHDLRRSFITAGWELGIPGTQIQTIAGHSSIATTASYDRGDLETALKSGERLHYPSMRAKRTSQKSAA